MGGWARNQVGIELSYRPARLHRLADWIPWNLFLGSLKFKNIVSGGPVRQPYSYSVPSPHTVDCSVLKNYPQRKGMCVWKVREQKDKGRQLCTIFIKARTTTIPTGGNNFIQHFAHCFNFAK